MLARSFAMVPALLPSQSCLGGTLRDHPTPEGHDLLAVLDFSEIAQAFHRAWPETPLPCPSSGKLCFFYNMNRQSWGLEPFDKEDFTVHFTHNALVDTSEHGRAIAFEPFVSQPSSQRLDDDPDRYQSFLDQVSESVFQGAHHQVFGYPVPLQQDDFEDLCAEITPYAYGTSSEPQEWVLLLQLTSDPSLNWMFAEMGTLYVFIRKQDLASGCFDRLWFSMQAY